MNKVVLMMSAAAMLAAAVVVLAPNDWDSATTKHGSVEGKICSDIGCQLVITAKHANFDDKWCTKPGCDKPVFVTAGGLAFAGTMVNAIGRDATIELPTAREANFFYGRKVVVIAK